MGRVNRPAPTNSRVSISKKSLKRRLLCRAELNLVEHHHFEFRHLVDGVTGALFTHAAVFEAAVGHQVSPPLGRGS